MARCKYGHTVITVATLLGWLHDDHESEVCVGRLYHKLGLSGGATSVLTSALALSRPSQYVLSDTMTTCIVFADLVAHATTCRVRPRGLRLYSTILRRKAGGVVLILAMTPGESTLR